MNFSCIDDLQSEEKKLRETLQRNVVASRRIKNEHRNPKLARRARQRADRYPNYFQELLPEEYWVLCKVFSEEEVVKLFIHNFDLFRKVCEAKQRGVEILTLPMIGKARSAKDLHSYLMKSVRKGTKKWEEALSQRKKEATERSQALAVYYFF